RAPGENVGQYPIYQGMLALSSNYALSYVGNNLTIAQAGTTTTVSSSATPSVYGQSVTLTAKVTSGSGTPVGTVTFYDGTTALATRTLDANGMATFSTSSLAVGSHTINVNYAGSGNFPASSGTLTQTVNKETTS